MKYRIRFNNTIVYESDSKEKCYNEVRYKESLGYDCFTITWNNNNTELTYEMR